MMVPIKNGVVQTEFQTLFVALVFEFHKYVALKSQIMVEVECGRVRIVLEIINLRIPHTKTFVVLGSYYNVFHSRLFCQ